MNEHKGLLIVVEAIDGGGKGNVVDGLEAFLRGQGLEVLRVAEPTSIGLGKFIREELTAKHADGRTYPGTVTAKAFAMDREALYKEKVLPFLAEDGNRVVLQDRGVLSSFVYQPVQDSAVTLDWLLSLDGNKLELSRPPDLLLVLRVDAAVAMQRLAGRIEKNDNSIFERSDFQEQVAARYRDPVLLAPFTERGTRVVEINSGQPKEAVVADAIDAVRQILP